MANNSYTFIYDLRVLLENDSDASFHGVVPSMVGFVKSLSIFPTRITNTIFNIISAAGILTNNILLAYIIYAKRYKSPVFCVILSLGVADLGVCVVTLIFYTLISPFVLVPGWICNVTVALWFVSFAASSLHIALFAILRFFQLVYPLASRAKVTTGLMRKVCLTIWCLSSTSILAGIYNYEVVNISTIATTATYVCINVRYRIQIIYTTIFWFGMPFIITSGFHVAKQVKVLSAKGTLKDQRVQSVRKQTDSRVLALTVVAYLVTIFPYIVQTIRVYVFKVTNTYIEAYLAEIVGQVSFTNSAINPWIYLFAAESVRSDVKKILTCNR